MNPLLAIYVAGLTIIFLIIGFTFGILVGEAVNIL